MVKAGEGKPTAASLWRIELARELTPFYSSHPGTRMVIVSGSTPKGLSDAYSDLDVIVFWDEMDVAWLEAAPLRDVECELVYSRKMGESDVYLESYYFGELKADFGHVTLDEWKKEVDSVLVDLDTSDSTQGALGGFRSSLPLYGEALFEEWRKRVDAYPEGLAEKMVRQNMRMFVPGYLLNQALGRGEVIAYYDGLCRMLKNQLGILCGLNRMYSFTEEPRWVEYYLGKMEVRPERAWERMSGVITAEGGEGVEILEGLTNDVLSPIEEHMPDVDVARLRDRRKQMTVRAREEKPVVRERKTA